jgi:hypothetical protein
MPSDFARSYSCNTDMEPKKWINCDTYSETSADSECKKRTGPAKMMINEVVKLAHLQRLSHAGKNQANVGLTRAGLSHNSHCVASVHMRGPTDGANYCLGKEAQLKQDVGSTDEMQPKSGRTQ